MISVIVPVYNVERFLPRCVRSIIAQTYRDFELLLIDDGSKDKSGSICDDFARQDRRIRVFHKQNGGLSDARNYGLDRMRGEYVTFIDSDDYVGEDYLKILMDMMADDKADVAEVTMTLTYSQSMEFKPSTDQRNMFEGDAVYREMLRGKQITWSAWAKLYKRETFADLRFPKDRVYEDLLTIPYIVSPGCRFACSGAVQYYYYQREGSIINSPSDEDIETWLEAMDKLRANIDRHVPSMNRYYRSAFVKSVFWRVIDWKLYSDSYVEVAGRIHRNYRAAFREALCLPDLNDKERIKGFAFYLSIRLYRTLRRRWIESFDNPDSRRYIQKKDGKGRPKGPDDVRGQT